MDSDNTQDSPASTENVSSIEIKGESNNIDSIEAVSSAADTTRELESSHELLTKIELDLACSTEKLVNLGILLIHVASRENDFEAFCSDEGNNDGLAERALEFNLLYGFLESEVREQESFLSDLQREMNSSREFISSFEGLGYDLRELEERLQDCVDSLKLSFEQVSDIKTQSASFERILLTSSGDEKCRDEKELSGLENDNNSDINAKIKMQTAEQQREILRMLEKSLAREMDLEKKLSESRQTEEELKFRLQQEVYCMEEEAEDMWEKLFEAENSSEILSGISKELLFSLNGSNQREGELKSKLEDLIEQSREKDRILEGSERSSADLLEKVHSLEQKLKDSLEKYEDLEVKATEAVKRAEFTEAECKSLKESNSELEKDIACLKNRVFDANERVEQLERLLKESEHNRVHAVASAEASQEKQSMLENTIKDMEDLIRDLKSKVLKAENQTEIVEEKCIVLSESNSELGEEINYLRRKVEQLEISLHEADEAKEKTAKDIRVRTKLITDLVMQLAVERERLRKQISSLTKEKKVGAKYLQRIREPTVTVTESHEDAELGNEHSNSSSTEDELNAVRNIDARQLNCKAILMQLLFVAIPLFTGFFFKKSGVES
ncbi:WPP domain-interacting tail-anchored protein 1 [Striga hermonthica]|uniref:WPP domain-interacting tail-anchored protein 1 n=1 Tax=Striga hermonthica TaxID=68872 RepID=A0A9N7MVY2_STRHE|nr:WPP domain-interacting tail-anchored protein 1 [Striga hermonthica]